MDFVDFDDACAIIDEETRREDGLHHTHDGVSAIFSNVFDFGAVNILDGEFHGISLATIRNGDGRTSDACGAKIDASHEHDFRIARNNRDFAFVYGSGDTHFGIQGEFDFTIVVIKMPFGG